MILNVLHSIAENFTTVVVFIIVLTTISISGILFAVSTTDKVKQCLLSWVIEAEKKYGNNTGEAKLSVVYGWFVTAFPIFKYFVSLTTFRSWVDEALKKMESLLSDEQIKRFS